MSPPRSISVVIPARRDVFNIPALIDRLGQIREAHQLALDVTVVADDSAPPLAPRPEPWVSIERTSGGGVSDAVLDGFRRATGDVLVCLTGDFSDEPRVIPRLLESLDAGADFVIGVHRASGSSAGDRASRPTLLARAGSSLTRPLTTASDPAARTFALTRSTFARGRDFAPTSDAIALELIVRCGCERVVEIPIDGASRGAVSRTTSDDLRYLRHLRRLYIVKYVLLSQLTQFLVVGGLGTFVNLAALTLFVHLGTPVRAAVALAIFIAMSFNFVLNRRFSFAIVRGASWARQFVGFAAASSIGAGVNYATTLVVLAHAHNVRPQIASLVGIAVGTFFNFAASRHWVFKEKH
jgi:dolichol-phosphate mannosyltransferase